MDQRDGDWSALTPANYPYGSDFQDELARALLQDDKALQSCRGIVNPAFFSSETLSWIIEACLQISEITQASPGKASILEELRRKDRLNEDAQEKVEELYEEVPRDLSYLQSRAAEFARQQAVINAIGKSIDLVGDGRYDELEDNIRQALLVGQDAADEFYDYRASLVSRLRGFDQEESNGIPTGIGGLDAALWGGMRAGELGIVMAPPAHGKTTALINFGKAALLTGRSVMHITLEIDDWRVARRYDACLAGMPKEKLMSMKKTAGQRILAALEKATGYLTIRRHKGRALSPAGLESAIIGHIESGKRRPDLLIVDYADLMRSDREYGEKRHELSQIYETLRDVGGRMGCVVWTASQVNRAELANEVISVRGLAECWDKASIADVIVSLNQDLDERQSGRMRMFLAKNREGESHITIPLFVDWACSRMVGEDDDES